MLEEEAALLERAEGSQVAGSKCKEVAAGDEEGQWLSKKARGKRSEERLSDYEIHDGTSLDLI